jgi:hypothetical protein
MSLVARASITAAFAALALVAGCSSSAATSGPDPDAGADAASRPTSVELGAPQRFSIAAGEGDHLAFPSVARRSDGTLLLTYRRGASHVDPTGRLMKQTGSADGRTWSTPEVLYDTPDVDDRDPSLTVTSKGDVMVSWFPYRTVTIGSSSLSVHHVAVARSTDGGKSFGAPVSVTKDPDTTGAKLDASGKWVDASGAPIVLEATSSPMREIGGALILPTYGGPALNLSALASATRSRISLQTSVDDGATWSARVVSPDDLPNVWLQEPALLAMGGADARWLLFARAADAASPSSAGRLRQAVSDDGGKSFGAWRSLDFVGHAPDVVRLSSGALVLAVRELDDAMTKEWVSIVTSVDDGATWSAPVRLQNCQAVECGYPSMLELASDSLLVVWYQPGGASIVGATVPVTTTY